MSGGDNEIATLKHAVVGHLEEGRGAYRGVKVRRKIARGHFKVYFRDAGFYYKGRKQQEELCSFGKLRASCIAEMFFHGV